MAGIAGILALGREREVEVAARLQPAALQDRLHDLRRGARPRGRFEHDQLALAQMRRDRVRRLLDIAQIRLAVRRQWRRYADDDGVHVAHLVETRGGAQSPGGNRGADLRARNVPEVALAGIDAGGLLRVDIKTDHPEARRPRGQCEWHAHIAKPDDTDDGLLAGIQIVHCELRFARMSLEGTQGRSLRPYTRAVDFKFLSL